jgi:hypothetical protein
MQTNVYTRERKHIRIKWSRVTCLALPLATAQSLGSQVLEDSQSRWRLTVAIGNKQSQQINKQYTKQYLKSNQIVPKYSTRFYEHVSARITEIGVTVKKL